MGVIGSKMKKGATMKKGRSRMEETSVGCKKKEKRIPLQCLVLVRVKIEPQTLCKRKKRL